MQKRERADRLLVARGLVESRSRAQSLIESGHAFANGAVISKVSQALEKDSRLEIRGEEHPWVSRGGVKLDHALQAFPVRVEASICLDVGASTGGFCDVLLSKGAARIYAVDVGHDQLHQKLKADERVLNLEGINARHLSGYEVPEPVDLLVCDASFISLAKILPMPLNLVRKGGQAVVLIKPQFEVGRARLGKGGIVRDPALHREVCDDIAGWFATQPGWRARSICDSPILGPDGNREFLLMAEKDA